jgi:hypothetical protein
MKDEEIIKKLGNLGERLRLGLKAQKAPTYSNAKICLAIADTVKKQFVKDMKQMLRDLSREAPPDNPKELLERRRTIEHLKYILGKQTTEKGSDPGNGRAAKTHSEISGKTVKERGQATAHLKSSVMKRARPTKPITKSGQSKKG